MNRLAAIAIDAAWEALAPGAERGCERCPWLSTSRERYDIGEHQEWARWVECEAPGPERCPLVRNALADALMIIDDPSRKRRNRCLKA